MDGLLANLRESADKITWSKGVALSRENRIRKIKSSKEEILIQVFVSGRTISPVVKLWPEDADWNCDCMGKVDPCEHVVAAAIFAKHSEHEEDSKEEKISLLGQIVYDFYPEANKLQVRRFIAYENKLLPFKGRLNDLTQGAIKDLPRVTADKIDVEAELLFEQYRFFEKQPVVIVQKLLQILHDNKDCRYMQDKVFLHKEPVGWQALVQDVGGGIEISGRDDERIVLRFTNGFVLLRENVLAPYNDADLNSTERSSLQNKMFFGRKDFAFVASELLPALEKKIKVRKISKALPQLQIMPPRIIWEAKSGEHGLSFIAKVAYGDPIIATVDKGHLSNRNQEVVPLRNIALENELEIKLKEQFHTGFGQAHEHGLSSGINFLRAIERSGHEIEGINKKHFTNVGDISVNLNLEYTPESGEFPLKFAVKDSDKQMHFASSEAVLQAFANGESLVPLTPFGFGVLPKQWMMLFGHRVKQLLAARDAEGKLPKAMLFSVCDLLQEMSETSEVENANAWLQKLKQGIEKDFANACVAKVNTVLRSYQEEGVKWLASLQGAGLGALLADDMGLGKTLQAICIIKSKTLVIAPTSVLYNWENEIKRFRPELTICVYHGAKRDIDLRADVTLTSYHTLRLDLSKFKQTTWKVLILDEAQMIKNYQSQLAKSAFALSADFRVALSGTPVENRLTDLWSLFHFLNRGLLGTFSVFNEDYVRPIERGEGNIAGELLKRIKPFVLRRLKTQVAKELPARTEIVRYCELSTEEFHLYQSVRLATEKEVLIKLGDGGNYLQALEALLRLRQACCHPSLLPGQTSHDSSSKIDVLLQELETCIAAGSKALVFSQWTSFLDCIERSLKKEGYKFLRIDGSTIDRGAVVETFNNDDDCRIMLLSLKAAGVGLNLTVADHVFIMDPWWNPAVEDQAADRAHRIGQEKPVLITRIVAKNTVEEKILDLQKRKKHLANAVIELDQKAKVLTREDLLELLN